MLTIYHFIIAPRSADEEFQTLCFEFGLELDEVVSARGFWANVRRICILL